MRLHSHNDDEPEDCPNCGKPYSKSLGVTAGDRHSAIFPAPPHTLYAKYPRICAHPVDAQQAVSDTTAPVRLYVHRMGDLGA